MKIKLQLRDIVHSDKGCAFFGFNPYCINEGADGDEWIEMKLSVAKELNLV